MATVEPFLPRTRRWTRAEYYRLAELGWFQDQRVERVEGEIWEMTPQGVEHAIAIQVTAEALRGAFGAGHSVREQLPLEIGDDSDPEPDVAVVAGRPRDLKRHPSTALLVVEIADSSLAYDRGRKAALYARAGIQEYWIVNLLDRQVEVHRKPAADNSHAFAYTDRSVARPNETIRPLAAADAMIAVADLLP